MRLDKQSLQFALHENSDVLEAYEQLIHDAMSGDHTLFTTADGIERLLELSTPLPENPPPVRPYAPGSWGPNAIHQLIAPHAWRLPFERGVALHLTESNADLLTRHYRSGSESRSRPWSSCSSSSRRFGSSAGRSARFCRF